MITNYWPSYTMAGGSRGGAPSFLHTGSNMSANEHINDANSFLHSTETELIPYDCNVSSAEQARVSYGMTSVQTSVQYQLTSDKKLVAGHLSKDFSDDPSTGDFFTNKKRGKTKKKSSSTVSSNTSSSYSSSSGVESMTAGNTGECNTISDKDKCQNICSAIDHPKETMYAVGQWLRFLQMDNYL